MKIVTEFPEGKATKGMKYHSRWSGIYDAVERGEIVMLGETDLQGNTPQKVAESIRNNAKKTRQLDVQTTVRGGCVYVRMRPE